MSIILPLHIIVALSSLVYTAYLFFNPSKKGLNISYAMVAFTFVSGFYLILTKPAHMTQTCIEGLAYLTVEFFGLLAARKKLILTKTL